MIAAFLPQYSDCISSEVPVGSPHPFDRSAAPVRTVVSVDLYNALNANPVLAENAAYRDTTVSGWRIPTSILPARFAKFGVQVDF